MNEKSSPVTQYGWFNNLCLYQSYDSKSDIGEYLQGDCFYRFVFFTWDVPVAKIIEWLAIARQRRPDDVFYFLCNDEFQVHQLQMVGLSALHISHNAFLDERLYALAESDPASRPFDAVYIARMNRFKRHSLAQNIPRILLIGSVVAAGDDQAYFEELAALMPHAEMSCRQKPWLRTEELAARLNEASVGLILSAAEGGSYATTEYLLCGLPVVSTASHGGRDCWLHPQFSRVVPASPQAIAEAVAELKACRLSPWDIRDYAMTVITEHRRRFFELGQRIYAAENCGRDFARDFYVSFHSKMADWRPNHDVMSWRNKNQK